MRTWALYRRYWRAVDAHLDSMQEEWDALPLWLRVAMCARCGWLDAVYEVDPVLGRELDELLHGPR